MPNAQCPMPNAQCPMPNRNNSRSHSCLLRAIANLTNHDYQINLYAAP
ncbi:hypothetical protein [Calothrix sp. NIES-2100]